MQGRPAHLADQQPVGSNRDPTSSKSRQKVAVDERVNAPEIILVIDRQSRLAQGPVMQRGRKVMTLRVAPMSSSSPLVRTPMRPNAQMPNIFDQDPPFAGPLPQHRETGCSSRSRWACLP